MTALEPDIARDGPDLTGIELHARLSRAWTRKPGFIGWLSTTDHKEIGRRYIVTAFIFLALGGALALIMRAQLATPESGLITADRYNQIFTMHGTTMMFLFAVPVMEAVAIYIIPLMLGTRNIAFPRLNAFSYWMYLAGALLLWGAFVLNIGPDAGWFSYTPLSGPQYSPGKRVDIWAQMVTFTEIAALCVAVELVATILKQRAPGMSLARMPLFAWAMLVVSLMIIFSMPAIATASAFLMSDRLVGTNFYNPAEGGDALLWQHMFWFFGHPEVYIIFLPAAGFVSEIVSTFSRRPTFGYTAIVVSMCATGLLAFGLWVHHMFATGLPRLGYAFYTAASMTVSIPTGVQIFCWIATIWLGRPRFRVPLLWVIGFIVTFVLGGLTGVMLASVPLDLQLHDSYFVVAHFHYVLVTGAVFAIMGSAYYWLPKWCGNMYSERWGKIHFWMSTISVNVLFFPQHFLGLAGMPRRIPDYNVVFADWNLISSIGAFGMFVTPFLMFGILFHSLKKGALAPARPWESARGLEWTVPSPAPHHTFATPPVIRDGDLAHGDVSH